MRAFTPSIIRSIPAAISSPFVGRCFSFPPKKKPREEFTNVTKAIRRAGFKIRFPKSESEIPAENASILVAIPTRSRHLMSIQSCLDFSFSNASRMNLTPR